MRHAPKVRTAAAANTVVALGTLAMRGLSIHGKCSTTMLVMWIQSTSDGDVVVCKLVDNPMTKLYMWYIYLGIFDQDLIANSVDIIGEAGKYPLLCQNCSGYMQVSKSTATCFASLCLPDGKFSPGQLCTRYKAYIGPIQGNITIQLRCIDRLSSFGCCKTDTTASRIIGTDPKFERISQLVTFDETKGRSNNIPLLSHRPSLSIPVLSHHEHSINIWHPIHLE